MFSARAALKASFRHGDLPLSTRPSQWPFYEAGKNVQKRLKTFKNIQKYSKNGVKTFENVRKRSEIFKNIPKRSNFLDTDCAEKKAQKSEDRSQKTEVNYLPQKGTENTKK